MVQGSGISLTRTISPQLLQNPFRKSLFLDPKPGATVP